MGKAFAKLGWDRDAYVVSSKFFWGLNDGPNRRNTLNRKYLMHAIDGSLERFGLDFLDLIFCHRADPNTPIEETVWAMSRHHRLGQGALLGHVGVDRRRDPRRVGHRRQAQPAQAGDGAAAVQPVRAATRSSASTPVSTRTSVSASPRGARSRRGCSPASTSTADPRRQPRRAAGLRVAPGHVEGPDVEREGQAAARRRRRTRLHARPARRSPGARRTRTSRPSSPAPAAPSRSSTTSAPWTCFRRLDSEKLDRLVKIARG